MDRITNSIQTIHFQESTMDDELDTTRTVVQMDLILHWVVAATASSTTLGHSCHRCHQTNYYGVHLDRDSVIAKVI